MLAKNPRAREHSQNDGSHWAITSSRSLVLRIPPHYNVDLDEPWGPIDCAKSKFLVWEVVLEVKRVLDWGEVEKVSFIKRARRLLLLLLFLILLLVGPLLLLLLCVHQISHKRWGQWDQDSDNILQRNQAGNLLTKSSSHNKHHLLLLLPPPPPPPPALTPTIAYLSLIAICWLLVASLAAIVVVVVDDVIISFGQRTHCKVSGGGVFSVFCRR